MFEVIGKEKRLTYKQIHSYWSYSNKILKQNAQIYPKNLADIFNESIKMGKFPDILKKAEVPPVCKKNNMNDKLNDNFLSD